MNEEITSQEITPQPYSIGDTVILRNGDKAVITSTTSQEYFDTPITGCIIKDSSINIRDCLNWSSDGKFSPLSEDEDENDIVGLEVPEEGRYFVDLDLNLDPMVSHEKIQSIIGNIIKEIAEDTRRPALNDHYTVRLLKLVEASFSHGFNQAVKAMDIQLVDDLNVTGTPDGD